MTFGAVALPDYAVRFATNTFINVPTILQFEQTALLRMVRSVRGIEDEVNIYNEDGLYLAKVKGSNIFPTKEGEKNNIRIERKADAKVLLVNGRERYVLKTPSRYELCPQVELYTPEGQLLVGDINAVSGATTNTNRPLNLNSIVFSHNTFVGCNIGIWFDRLGNIAVAADAPPQTEVDQAH